MTVEYSAKEAKLPGGSRTKIKLNYFLYKKINFSAFFCSTLEEKDFRGEKSSFKQGYVSV